MGHPSPKDVPGAAERAVEWIEDGHVGKGPTETGRPTGLSGFRLAVTEIRQVAAELEIVPIQQVTGSYHHMTAGDAVWRSVADNSMLSRLSQSAD